MNTINKTHFQQLTADREDSLRLLNKNSMRGIRDSVVERYSEQAHFVYELLQNADDVQATEVQFKLRKEGLYFVHNGNVPFTVTPPNTRPAGHINAITSIGASSKKDENYKIGKFGIGFKSVFQYTQTPHIFDPNVAFKIRDLIVPELLNDATHPLRKKGETLFFFPFDHAEKSAVEAQAEIEHRLQELVFPLLFLNYLEKISWETANSSGYFAKKILEKEEKIASKNSVSFRKVCSEKKVGKTLEETHFIQLLKAEKTTQLPYSVVFVLDENNAIDFSKNYPAHCFFPTRVQPNLRFLIHAPFLLTDSREGIKLEDAWNKNLVQQLAKLPLESLPILKEKGYLNTTFFRAMPHQEKHFSAGESRAFKAFFEEWFSFLKNDSGDYLPCYFQNNQTSQLTDNQYFTNNSNAFLAESQSLRELLSAAQLSELLEQKEAKWAFPEVPLSSDLGVFLKTVLIEYAQLQNGISPVLSWEFILRKMAANFLEKQSDEWLIYLYEELLSNHRSLWFGEKAVAKQVPLIRLKNGAMVRPFSAENGKPKAYLPTHLTTNYPTVKKVICDKVNARLFLENLGLTTPELRAELEQYILPKYRAKKTRELPTPADLEKLFLHYQKCNEEEAANFCAELRELPILVAVQQSSGELVAASPNQVYFLEKRLQNYFENATEEVLWLDLETCYLYNLQNSDQQRFIRFLERIGVAHLPRFLAAEDTLKEAEKRELLQQQTPGASYAMWEEMVDISLHSLEDFLAVMTLEKSLLLWRLLEELLEQNDLPTKGIYRYEYEETHEVKMDAHWVKMLRNSAWLFQKNEQVLAANQLTINELHNDYAALSGTPIAELLFSKNTQERLNLLTAEERQAMEIGQRLLQQGLQLEDWQKFQKWQQKNTKEKPKKERKKKRTPAPEPKDVDEFNPAFLSSEELLAKQEELRQKLELELEEQMEELMVIERLKATLKEVEKYSFLWFKTLLELELLLALDQTDKDKSLRIEFLKIEHETDTSKTILLKQPVRYIPQNIEAMGDITLKIQLEKERKTVAVDVVSVKSNSLRAKLRSPEELEGIDFEKVRGAVLQIQNTIFTLEELKRAFFELDFQPEDSLQMLLPSNVRFIFGPPGTGKTTHLATQEILPSMMGEKPLNMLVLAPTNKSADVLVRKILALQPDPPDWLYRFGTSGDAVVENAGILCDKTLKFDALERTCIVTTATRFPYDGFGFGHPAFQLKNIDWDVIIIDEASMISLPMITYILQQKSLAEIVIAGDPFQIEPVVFAEEWKGENIYSMVNLQSFDPEKQREMLLPHPFEVHNLTTQYRAISTLGYIFSHFAYEGKLRHHRMPDSRRALNINDLQLKDVNIIRFPVNKLETLYRPQRLNGSHYQLYSALLTSEIVKYLVTQIYEQHIEGEEDAKPWRIGIICPYKAQAMLVDKVIASQAVFRPKVNVSCGTIHSFQGDECDILLNLFNPPYSISRSPNMFLNRQNILNVAVSRAKEYLILLLPDEQTENVENLYQIHRLQQIIRYYLAGVCQKWHAYEIEEILFGQTDYIEQNAFATTHQSINVYTQPEKRFEIRVEDTAVDVQIEK